MTKSQNQLNRLIDSIQQSELDTLEKQRQQLAAYVDSHGADIEEDADIAVVIREVENYLSDRADDYITAMNRIGKILTGRDAVAEYIAANNLPYVECGAE